MPEPPEDTPPHHGPRGRYRNPWPLGPEPGAADLLRWAWQRHRADLPPDPLPEAIPRADARIARPRLPATSASAADDPGCRITWIGHASFLLQLPGCNVLTDPVFSRRASPLRWAGPARFSPPGITVDELPPIDAVVLSHDHYDHLDRWTVDRLHERFGDQLVWFVPCGHAAWLRRRRVRRAVELDWWEDAVHEADDGPLRVRALPARHWTSRRPWGARKRLWCSWSIEAGGRRVYFGGDSGYGPGYREIARREAPYDAVLLPIGAYEPRWFMRSSHMSPEEAVQASVDLGGGVFVGMHWGTFRLTDEDPLEPPVRARRAWSAMGRPEAELRIPALGETIILDGDRRRTGTDGP